MIWIIVICWLLLGALAAHIDWWKSFREFNLPYILVGALVGPFMLLLCLAHYKWWR